MSGPINSGLPMIPATWVMQALSPPAADPIPKWREPDPQWADHFGWREWEWHSEKQCLESPSMRTLWLTDSLKACKSNTWEFYCDPENASEIEAEWDEGDVIRGVMGVHALLVPRHWRALHGLGLNLGYGPISGIVERYGKYVLGAEGWRAEHVVIREILAPSTEIGLLMEQRYPEVIIHYPDQQGESKWTSEKSNELEKGSRSSFPSPPLLKDRPQLTSQPAIQSQQNQLESLLKKLGLLK